MRPPLPASHQVTKHLGVAKKVNDFLQSAAPEASARREHGARMQRWLATLETQVSASMLSAPKPELPKAALSRAWGEGLAEAALLAVDRDMHTYGLLTHRVAAQVQQAIIVALVIGSAFPPLRLDLIKNLNTPAATAAHGCLDPDCLEGARCLGNRIEIVTAGAPGDAPEEDDCSPPFPPAATWHFGYGLKRLRIHVRHGKNDRRACRANYQICFAVPDGSLHRLLLAHITEGHKILTLEQPDDMPMPRLFITSARRAFSNVTFVHYWKTAMRTAEPYNLPYFCPSQARTMFVEDYTSANGVEPEMWDGAAAVMGTTVEQWKASYNPSRKRRAVEQAVAMHARFTGVWEGPPGPGFAAASAGLPRL